MLLWGSAPAMWTKISTVDAAVTASTTDALEGDSSFEFNVPAGTEGGVFVYGANVPIDPRFLYRGWISAKLVNGAGDFSAGYQAFDAAGTMLTPNTGDAATYFIARNSPLVTGSWTNYTGLVSGEGTGATQFPVGTRFIRPVVVVNRNNIGTTRIDALRFAPDHAIRTVTRWQGYINDGTDNGALGGRTVTLTKLFSNTGLRVHWSDNFRVIGTNACRWQVVFNGNACTSPGGLVFDKYANTGDYHEATSVVGTCFGINSGTVVVSTRVTPTPGYSTSDCYTGWSAQLASLEVEEVY